MGGRVLMVAHHFPPSGAVASIRASKFAFYLPEFGWEPAVVAARPDRRQPSDPSLEGRPAPRVVLAPFEPARALGLLPPFLREPLRRIVSLPDEELGWMASLLRRLPGAVEEFRPDVIWANSVPTGSLVAAAWTARRTGLPFVADFHNEWVRNVYYRPASRLHDAAHRSLERFVVRTARAVVTLNPLHTEDLRQRFPGTALHTVENGFDPADRRPGPAPSRGLFVYAGAVYGGQSPEPFLRALAASGLGDVRVRIVGDKFSQFSAGTWPFPVSVEGYVPYAELGPVLAEASACFLCLEPTAARQLPAKLYEYLGAGKPVFAIAPRGGAVDRWLRETPAGVCVPAEDPGAWAPALRSFVQQLGEYRPPPAGAFERRALAGRLAAVLDSARRAVDGMGGALQGPPAKI